MAGAKGRPRVRMAGLFGLGLMSLYLSTIRIHIGLRRSGSPPPRLARFSLCFRVTAVGTGATWMGGAGRGVAGRREPVWGNKWYIWC